MDYIIICLVALIGSGLTLFSGFGLGTLLTPVFALFFPVEIAVAMTAVVHFLNNLFKLTLVGRAADWSVVKQFGIPSVIAAIIGALALKALGNTTILTTYTAFEHVFEVSLLKIIIGLLLIVFAFWEILPSLSALSFDKKYLPLGGFLSGFFGGLAGLQGALRSAFLIKIGLTKESFIATGVVIACLIDVSRLGVYAEKWTASGALINWQLIAASTLSAFVGAYFGAKMIKKVTIDTVQRLVAALLVVFGGLMMAGII
jgi:uncharacterized protein